MMSNEVLLAECIRVVNRAFLGMLTTVDETHMPCARWMGTATAENGLHTLYTLTGKNSRKLAHVRGNPNVCWVFSDTEYNDIVTLYGQAIIHTSPLATQQVWDRLCDFARTWCTSKIAHEQDMEFVTLETSVTKIEFMSPRLKIYQPTVVNFVR